MKILIMIAVAAALVSSFLPKAEAGESAQLGLTVTFNQPLRIWTEPAGPFEAAELKTLEFRVIAEDVDATDVSINVVSLPEGAEYIPDPVTMGEGIRTSRSGTFKWTPKMGDGRDEPYVASLKASSCYYGERPEEVILEVNIIVLQAEISIELEPSTWLLEGVKLGEKRQNLNMIGEPIHAIRNTGNVPVMAGISYAPIGPVNTLMILPGLEQGVNTFITAIYREGIPDPTTLHPDSGLKVAHIEPNEKAPLHLMYGAPTALREGTEGGHSVSYEVRAYYDGPPSSGIER